MSAELKLTIKSVRLTGRTADFARRALSLPSNGDRLVIEDRVPLVVPVNEALAAALEVLYGSLKRPRKVDSGWLPGGALVDVNQDDGQGHMGYQHTVANPLWWTPARIALAWVIVAQSEFTGQTPDPSEISMLLYALGKGK